MKKILILLLTALTLFAFAQDSSGTTDSSGTESTESTDTTESTESTESTDSTTESTDSTDTTTESTDTSMESTDAASTDAAAGTVADVITSSPDHATLLAAVEAAGLAETLAGTGPYTVFAPNDSAFEAYVASAGLASADDLLADPNLASVLEGHVVSGALLSADILAQAEAAGGTLEVAALNGSPITVTVDGGTVTLNGSATVTTADLAAGNGVVHVIDGVLAPAAAQ
ncbi:MAG: fasciclin domain-containing protein [Trueperaceae bacterium]